MNKNNYFYNKHFTGEDNPFFGKHHTEESRAKISKAHLGRKCSPETKEKLRHVIPYIRTPEIKEKMRLAALALHRTGEKATFYGKHHTRETKGKISKGNLGKHVTLESRQKMRLSHITKENKEKHRKEMLKRWSNNEYRERVTSSIIKSHSTPEFGRKMTEANLKRWQNPEYKNRVIKAMMKSIYIKPNKVELAVYQLLEDVCPNQYEYTGDGGIIIGGKCPDFTNVNGQKRVIELFGDYWHKEENPQVKIDKYAEFGFDCLVIWEHELKNCNNVMVRIRDFNN